MPHKPKFVPNVDPDDSRADELAAMENLGLAEVIELTGIGAGAYGIYLVSSTGISVGESSPIPLASLNFPQQPGLLQAQQRLQTSFPCTPQELFTWYEATRGKNGVSDFPMSRRFINALQSPSGSKDQLASVTSDKIVDAFHVSKSVQNRTWWSPFYSPPGP